MRIHQSRNDHAIPKIDLLYRAPSQLSNDIALRPKRHNAPGLHSQGRIFDEP